MYWGIILHNNWCQNILKLFLPKLLKGSQEDLILINDRIYCLSLFQIKKYTVSFFLFRTLPRISILFCEAISDSQYNWNETLHQLFSKYNPKFFFRKQFYRHFITKKYLGPLFKYLMNMLSCKLQVALWSNAKAAWNFLDSQAMWVNETEDFHSVIAI